MDGPGDYHTKCRKSDRERQIYDIAYMWIFLKNDTNKLIYKAENTLKRREEWGRKDRMVVWVWHVHIAKFKIDDQTESTV